MPENRLIMPILQRERAFVASARELSSFRCASDKFPGRAARSTVERDRNRVEEAETEHDMISNRNNSCEGQNGLSKDSDLGSEILPGLAFDIGHGIDRGINPIALEGIGTTRSDILVKICLLGHVVRIRGGVGTKNTGRRFRTIRYYTLVHLQYKVQIKDRGMYSTSTYAGIGCLEDEEYVRVGLLRYLCGIPSLICSIVSSMEHVLTI